MLRGAAALVSSIGRPRSMCELEKKPRSPGDRAHLDESVDVLYERRVRGAEQRGVVRLEATRADHRDSQQHMHKLVLDQPVVVVRLVVDDIVVRLDLTCGRKEDDQSDGAAQVG